MTKTVDKVLLGVLIVLFIGMSGTLIAAMDDTREDVSSTRSLVVRMGSSESTFVESEDDDDLDEIDVSLTGTALERASAVALAYVGEGRVTDSEIGDEEGYYEIEITREDGSEVDVHLDQKFRVLGTESDEEDEND